MAEDVGKLPDNSVAEALARVTGIQIRRDAGEANSVLIRGLPNVVTLLNGREVFTTTGRFIALGDVPANLLQRVDVYKSNGASQVEGGIAGTIDVHTRRAFDNPGTHVNANARGPYNDKADTFNPNLGLTAVQDLGRDSSAPWPASPSSATAITKSARSTSSSWTSRARAARSAPGIRRRSGRCSRPS